ncbi:MAG: SUMF1/EgtB/PvdO family nonheme iron enzyme [Chitinophagaceae bacterium]
MKQISIRLIAVSLIASLWGCAGGGSGGSQGQLVGNNSKVSGIQSAPLGMVWVPSGVMHMGASDQDIRNAYDVKNRTVQMIGFFMDATEITNAEYRQYVDWVRDSTAHSIIGDYKDLDDGTQVIDWKKKIKWATEDVQDAMAAYYVPPTESIWGKKEFDNAKLQYHYEAFDFDMMARESGLHKDISRASYINRFDVPAYPDTAVWMKMFSYSYNEPITHQYFWHPSFNNYPVVGVNWHQAHAFCNWRTSFLRNYRDKKKLYQEGEFRLPSEEQWEWAARGGRTQSPFPWGGPYLVNKKGCYLANFKPNRGNYSADGGLYTVKADAYHPNDYGLYNMSGNVSEWTLSPYEVGTYNNVADMSPDIKNRLKETDPTWWKRKTIKGGSWKDVAAFLQVGNRDYEFADTAKAFIGFRCIIQYISPALTNKPPKKK